MTEQERLATLVESFMKLNDQEKRYIKNLVELLVKLDDDCRNRRLYFITPETL
ncbi:MAG: hypothetical protein LBG73_03815 [Spirochaetaceae bacterium]|jgi:hypothetical protein|nr:hypothetical protein [Spirochaetaceae bacterium]